MSQDYDVYDLILQARGSERGVTVPHTEVSTQQALTTLPGMLQKIKDMSTTIRKILENGSSGNTRPDTSFIEGTLSVLEDCTAIQQIVLDRTKEYGCTPSENDPDSFLPSQAQVLEAYQIGSDIQALCVLRHLLDRKDTDARSIIVPLSEMLPYVL
jgi:hypothetical protein